jgi:hypothetical protein
MSDKTMTVLTKTSLDELRGLAQTNATKIWESPLDDLITEYQLSTIEVDAEFQRGHDFIVGAPRDSRFDSRNAGLLRAALPGLTPSQATDERIWATLALSYYKEYVMKRWPAGSDAKQNVQNKIFVQGTRSLVREHSIARLWWRAHFASLVTPEHSKDPLSLIFSHEDIGSEIAARSIFTDERVLSAYFGLVEPGLERLQNDSRLKGLTPKLFIQRTAKKLNMLAGRYVFGLPEAPLSQFMSEAEKMVINDHLRASSAD